MAIPTLSIVGRALLLALCITAARPAAAQNALDAYFGDDSTRAVAEKVAQGARGARDVAAIRRLLPNADPARLLDFMTSSGSPVLRNLLKHVDASRLNKMLAGAPGGSGTSLVSGVAAPAVLGAAVEYGSILQQTTGTTTSLRGNLLGVGRLVFGDQQFPYCPELAQNTCSVAARRLRRISGSLSFEDVRSADARAAAGAAGDPTAAALLGSDYRVAAWGVRFDLTPSNNLDDPAFVRNWREAIKTLARHPAAEQLVLAMPSLFVVNNTITPLYETWTTDALSRLNNAENRNDFFAIFEEKLVQLIERLESGDPDFAVRVAALSRAYQSYFDVHDRLVREAQVHKRSLEYTNRRPQQQAFSSNIRFIYSHQPTKGPAIVTFNAAGSWYHQLPAAATSRLRDIQLAGQIDRRLGGTSDTRRPVLTFAGYYQWMKEDALIVIPDGTSAPGAGIELPGTAAKLLGTKGHLGVAQAKLTLPMSDVVKVPFSLTWATRKELIKEKDVRGQIGLTLDIDQLFR